MNNQLPLRFERAYNALVDAFFDGTLMKATCVCCAVGNIVAAAKGISKDRLLYLQKHDKMGLAEVGFWSILFCAGQMIDSNEKHKDKIQLLESLTGYKWRDVARIEAAFENNTKIDWINYDDLKESEILLDQYNGLKAVVDVLMEIDGLTGNYADKFLEHPKLQIA